MAATGVGAGDLATASIAGSKLGVAVLWAVVLGAFLKFVLTVGLARWHLVRGETLLLGVVGHLGRPAARFPLAPCAAPGQAPSAGAQQTETGFGGRHQRRV